MRLSTIRELAQREKLDLPYDDAEAFRGVFQVSENDERTLTKFISKFVWLRKLIADRETLARITFEAVEDAARDNVAYLELRFNHYPLLQRGLTEEDVITALSEGVSLAEKRYDIDVGLICGISRDLPIECADAVTDFAIRHMDRGIVALDLMNDERFSPELFIQQYARAKDAGLFRTVHAGEAAGPENIAKAIELLGAQRIGHGARMFQGTRAHEIARDQGVMIECCLTSNSQTGAVPDLLAHPLPRMLEAGVHACINTDDPGVSDITLTNEYEVASGALNLTDDVLKKLLANTVEHIFRPELRNKLGNRIAEGLPPACE